MALERAHKQVQEAEVGTTQALSHAVLELDKARQATRQTRDELRRFKEKLADVSSPSPTHGSKHASPCG
eukprot:513957-Prorocentrum_lima.AAC.1